MKKTLTTLASTALVGALALGVAACGSSTKADSSTKKDAPSAAASTTPAVTVNGDTATVADGSVSKGLPADFPTSTIPVVPGDVTWGVETSSGNFAVAVTSTSTLGDAAALLTAQGFTEAADTGTSSMLRSADWLVEIDVASGTVSYTVTKA